MEAVERRGTDFGNWSRPGVPHKGWVCIDMLDMDDELITCQMCEFAEVRYVHVMQNPEWPNGDLWVGCHCAARMESNYQDAEKREAEFKARVRNPNRAAEREAFESWVTAADELLLYGHLSNRERDFVLSIRGHMAWSARPRTKKYKLSEKQTNWFVSLYKREVKPREKEGVK
jgi:hypothetical protein